MFHDEEGEGGGRSKLLENFILRNLLTSPYRMIHKTLHQTAKSFGKSLTHERKCEFTEPLVLFSNHSFTHIHQIFLRSILGSMSLSAIKRNHELSDFVSSIHPPIDYSIHLLTKIRIDLLIIDTFINTSLLSSNQIIHLSNVAINHLIKLYSDQLISSLINLPIYRRINRVYMIFV